MAWWHTRLLFYGDDLIGVDLDRLVPEEMSTTRIVTDYTDWDTDESVQSVKNPCRARALRVTAVQVSGYALYGQLRGYYALGVAELAVDPQTGQATLADPDADLDPRRHLTPKQKQVVREWLKNHSPTAWDTSMYSFKQALE
jgi:hypothetical protein